MVRVKVVRKSTTLTAQQFNSFFCLPPKGDLIFVATYFLGSKVNQVSEVIFLFLVVCFSLSCCVCLFSIFSRRDLVEKSGCFELDEVGYLVTTGEVTWSTDDTEVSWWEGRW